MVLGIVIPVYHGSLTVGSVVDALRHFAGEQQLPCRVVLVEDGSDEASRAEVRRLEEQYPGVTAVLLERNVGQQRALYEGIQRLKDCDVIATMDDDGAHPVAFLAGMLAALAGEADLCYAIPDRKGYRVFRRVGAWLRDLFFTTLTGMPPGARVSAYRVMTRELATRLVPEPDGFIYLSAAAMRLKPRVVCLPCQAGPQTGSTYTWPRLCKLYTSLILHYTPLQLLLRRRERIFPGACEVRPGRGFLWEP